MIKDTRCRLSSRFGKSCTYFSVPTNSSQILASLYAISTIFNKLKLVFQLNFLLAEQLKDFNEISSHLFPAQ